MLFNVALFSNLLLSYVVLAFPSGLGARIARRGESHQSQVNNRLESGAGAISNVVYSNNWAGAVWSEGNATFSTVTGTFTVPTPSGSTGSSAAIWVGIDGDTCTNAILQTGIVLTVEQSHPTYSAWYEWYPALSNQFSNPIEISAGDDIKLTVVAWSPNSGTVTIENLTNNQLVSQSLNSSASLCGQDVEWIVEDYIQGSSLVPFADFGTVMFTNAVATGTQNYYPSGATIVEIEQNNNQVLTNVTTNGASVTIQYV